MPEAPAAPPAPAPNLAPPSEERGNIPGEAAETHADALGEAFSELDSVFGEVPASPPAVEQKQTPKAPPSPAPKPEAAKPPAKPGTPPKGPDGKFLPKPKEAPKPEAKPPEPAIEKMAPPELRKAYAELRKKHDALVEERAKAAAAPPPEPQDDPEKVQLNERLTEREKRLQALEEELRYTAYERSAEYKEKYEQPFYSAWQVGQERASRLKTVAQQDGMGDETAPARQGTPEDFNTLMLIQDDDEAAEWATRIFGAKAPALLYHRERVQEANMAKHKALEDFKKQGGEREKQQREFNENRTKAVRTLYFKSIESGIEKYPQYFKPDEADPKTKELLDKGFRLADRALGAPDAEGEKPLTGEQRIKLQGAMRNCFGSFQRLTYDLNKERSMRLELEKKVAEYEASEPRGGDGRAGGRPATSEESETPESAFDAQFGT